MPEPAAMLTIGQVALRSGVAPSALRFYEAEGLIASERSEGNQRRYPRAVLRRVARDPGRARRRHPAGGDRRRARAAARRPPAFQARLGAALARLAPRRRGAHRAARARARRPRLLHRLRLPLAALVPAVQPGRRAAAQAGAGARYLLGDEPRATTYSRHETGAHARVQRWRHGDPDHDPRARAAAARGGSSRRHPRREEQAARLPAELRDGRHLLEQPPPPVPDRRGRRRPHDLGEHAPALLALADAAGDGLARRAGREAGPGRRLRDRAARVRDSRSRCSRWRCSRSTRRARNSSRRSAAIARAGSRWCSTSSRSRSAGVFPWGSIAIFVAVAFIWFLPDRRVERVVGSA